MLNPVARRMPNRLRRPRVQFDHRLNRDARREEIIRHWLLGIPPAAAALIASGVVAEGVTLMLVAHVIAFDGNV